MSDILKNSAVQGVRVSVWGFFFVKCREFILHQNTDLFRNVAMPGFQRA